MDKIESKPFIISNLMSELSSLDLSFRQRNVIRGITLKYKLGAVEGLRRRLCMCEANMRPPCDVCLACDEWFPIAKTGGE